MLYNFWNQLFGPSFGTQTTETVTTTVINNSAIDADTNESPSITTIPLMSKHRHSRFTSDKRDIEDNCCAPTSNNNETSYFSVYILFGALFICILTIAILLLAHINRVSEIKQFRDNFKADFITRHDIKQVVWDVIQEMRNKEYMLTDNSQRPSYDGSDNVNNNEVYDMDERNRRSTERKHATMRERRAATRYMNSIVSDTQNAEPAYVDFFNPKIKPELEKKDDEIRKRTGLKGAAPGGDEWVWLTSYSRLPYDAITGFCSATKEYCPPGPAGIPGQPGIKGPRGDLGIPGPAGREGPIGPRGPKGMPGNPGLDGRDGVPGEPGLDGVPGRAGADGISGKDGKDGMPGIDGKNGINGKDGREGLQGPQGPSGLIGERGITGPRGRTGRPGINGSPGIPGINAWKVRVNGSDELLIPPSITAGMPDRPIVVNEGDHLRLDCGATGKPIPHVVWRRLDGKTISTGAWQASSIPGHTLNVTSINRVHMGAYQCFADNGVPVAANATFYVEVHFAPLVQVRKSELFAHEGASVTLECDLEAFPEPLKYWKRMSDNRIIDETDRFHIQTYTEGYKSSMQLNITRLRAEDFGEYQCVLKNDVNTTIGPIFVYDRFKHPPPTRTESRPIATYGPLPPRKESYEDICGPPATCPECPDFKCKDPLVTLHDLVGNLEINPTENNYPGLPPFRTTECILYVVGKPVYNKYTNLKYGAWLRDPNPKNDDYGEKIWATTQNDPYHVFEYANKKNYRDGSGREITLKNAFRGNAHVVYNGSFYYQKKDTNRIIRFDLDASKELAERELPKLAANGSNYLYTTEYNYIDFSVDDNGLWAIYTTADSNNTIVAKLDPNNLTTQYSWNISVNHHKVGEMFIVCGVLYAVDSVKERNTKIRFALDLYQNKLLDDVNLVFTNPFKNTTTIGYNHRTKELYTWDGGNQLTYPTRYHDLGLRHPNSTAGDRNEDNTRYEMHTGFQVFHDGSSGSLD